MLSFLSPLFLAGAAAAAVPIVLHLLKREPEARMKWAAVRLLKRAPVEHTARRHLRELILLALRVAAFLLLALAFARPFFATGAAVASSSVTIVALDTSYSLSAPGRFERAKRLAKDAIARAPAGDLVGVVTFADEAEILAKPGADRVLAAAAIDETAPGFGATRYRAALSAASQSLDGRRRAARLVGGRRGRRSGRYSGRQRPLRRARRPEPAIGPRRNRLGRPRSRSVLRAARADRGDSGERRVSSCERGWRAAGGVDRRSAGGARGGAAVVDARPRAPGTRAAVVLRAE